jgi:hypothetical protein
MVEMAWFCPQKESYRQDPGRKQAIERAFPFVCCQSIYLMQILTKDRLLHPK